MDSIIPIIILFFVLNTVFRLLKRVVQPAKKTQQTQEQIEATKPKEAPKPALPKEDFRFPPVPKAKPEPAFQPEGRNPAAVMGKNTLISPFMDLHNQFSAYQGSLQGASTEGVGYQTDDFDPVEAQYQMGGEVQVAILPESFSRDTLLQAVVMSEVLKRPGVKR